MDEDKQKMAQEQQKKYGEPAPLFHCLGTSLLILIVEIMLQEMPAKGGVQLYKKLKSNKQWAN